MHSEIHRLFFALRPDSAIVPDIVRAVDTVKATKLIRGSWLAASKHHLTVHFLGDYPALSAAIVERAKSAAASVKFAPFEFVLDSASSFCGRRQSPCVLRCSPDSETALQSFWRELGEALIPTGLGALLERRFMPHLTIAYGDNVLAEPIPVSPIVWQVNEFVLIDSHVGRSNHEVLDRWRLPRHDAAPIRPVEPDPADCCGEGCPHCVFDVYDAALERYEAELAARRARQSGQG
jgi:2'-5' RNA ligase